MFDLIKRTAALAALVVLSGCAGKSVEVARYDLNIAARPVGTAPLELREVTMTAATWLDSPQIAFRLRYAKPARRDAYLYSRWVASPQQLLLSGVKRGLGVVGASRSGCRLQIELDEWVQDFSSPTASEARIEARVRLSPAQGVGGERFRSFSVRVPADTADAEGGVNALARGSDIWIRELSDWLTAVSQNEATKKMCQG